MVEIEEGSLGAFEEDLLAGLEGPLDELFLSVSQGEGRGEEFSFCGPGQEFCLTRPVKYRKNTGALVCVEVLNRGL